MQAIKESCPELNEPHSRFYDEFTDAEVMLNKWSPNLTFHTYALSDFEDMEEESFSDQYEPDVITVEPCEAVIFQVRSDNDFADNWFGRQTYGLYTAAFVDAEEDSSEGGMYGHYAVRIPCNVRPGSRMVYGEFNDGVGGMLPNGVGLDLWYDHDGETAGTDGFRRTVRVSF